MYYAYLRVSTETQAEHGGGLDTQKQNIDAYCAAHGITLDHVYTDAGISGAISDTDEDAAITKRPALVEMLATLQDGDTVIVLNTSRLWRSDTAKVIIRRELMKRHAKVIDIEKPSFDLNSRNPNDRLTDGLMGLLDEWERLTICMKLAKGRTAKAKRGDKPAGTVPFGYEYTPDKKHIEVNAQQAAIVRLMFSECQRGRSLSAIAQMLNAKGIKTPRGKDWTAGTVQSIIRNDFYTGVLTHNGEKITGNHTAIINKIVFGKAAAQLKSRRR